MQQADFDVFERRGKLGCNVGGNKVGAARVGGEGEGVLRVGCARHFLGDWSGRGWEEELEVGVEERC